MAMGRRRKGRQRELFVAASEVRALGNPFYRALNRLAGSERLRRVRGGGVP